jgi:hypothetical protein
MLHTRRLQRALDEFSSYFDKPKQTFETFSEGLHIMFKVCPSLESMVFQKHDAKVLNAWIYLMVHHKELVSKIGPKNS